MRKLGEIRKLHTGKVYIDDRVGSKELASRFPKDLIKLGRLPFGDLAFLGNGPEEGQVAIAIERKTISDLCDSMSTGRLTGHQVPGLRENFDYIYIVVEGDWRTDPKTGLIQVRKRTWEHLSHGRRRYKTSSIMNFLNTLEVCSGIHVRRCLHERDTVELTLALYEWWNKPFKVHESHIRDYVVCEGGKSLVYRVARQFPNIGPERAEAIDRAFSSLDDMVNAGLSDWVKIKGVSKETAARIMAYIEGLETLPWEDRNAKKQSNPIRALLG